MGAFLNSRIPYESFRLAVRDPYYVDKTALLSELIPALDVENRFFLYHETAAIRQNRHGQHGGGIFWKGGGRAGTF